MERLILDVRPPEEFAEGHRADSLNIQLGWDQLDKRVRSYVPNLATPIAVRAATKEEGEHAAGILKQHGYTDVSLPGPGDDANTLPLTTAAELQELLASDAKPTVLDIRSRKEQKKGTIPGAIEIDEDAGPEGVQDLDRAGSYAVICAGGWRSSQLASWMRREGFEDVTNVIDGMTAWKKLR